jgi:hypothetical protein
VGNRVGRDFAALPRKRDDDMVGLIFVMMWVLSFSLYQFIIVPVTRLQHTALAAI